MEPQYEYYAIVTDAQPLVTDPAMLCRRWVDEHGQTHEELSTYADGWVPNTALAEARSGEHGTRAHQITAAAAAHFVANQGEPVSALAPEDGRYEYFAWVVDGLFPLDSPRQVIRTWTSPQGHDLEERLTLDHGWVSSHVRHDINRRDMDGDLVPISEDDAERFRETAARRRRESNS